MVLSFVFQRGGMLWGGICWSFKSLTSMKHLNINLHFITYISTCLKFILKSSCNINLELYVCRLLVVLTLKSTSNDIFLLTQMFGILVGGPPDIYGRSVSIDTAALIWLASGRSYSSSTGGRSTLSKMLPQELLELYSIIQKRKMP